MEDNTDTTDGWMGGQTDRQTDRDQMQPDKNKQSLEPRKEKVNGESFPVFLKARSNCQGPK